MLYSAKIWYANKAGHLGGAIFDSLIQLQELVFKYCMQLHNILKKALYMLNNNLGDILTSSCWWYQEHL